MDWQGGARGREGRGDGRAGSPGCVETVRGRKGACELAWGLARRDLDVLIDGHHSPRLMEEPRVPFPSERRMAP